MIGSVGSQGCPLTLPRGSAPGNGCLQSTPLREHRRTWSGGYERYALVGTRPHRYQPAHFRAPQNHEENERRWATGTFTRSLRERLERDRLPSSWLVWLSINQDNDGTAIWLQRKFDVPASGTWLSDKIFQIAPPNSTGDAEDGAPGLIIFECTPFEDLDDELEKKYRILDDCARLREALLALPEGRHFLPSLLLILWSELEPSVIGLDLQDMVGNRLS